MKRFALLLPLMACTTSTPDSSTDHVGTWERSTVEGVERLTLGEDGSFKLHAPDMPQFGPDVDRVTGTYVLDGQELQLTGTSSDGTAIEAEFTFAAAGDTFVRGATVHEVAGDDWFGHYRVKVGDQQSEQLWTITQAPDGWFASEYMTADTGLARYDVFYHEGRWEQRGDEVRFTYGDKEHAEVEIDDGERRGVTPSLTTCGIRHGASPGQALMYTRVVHVL